MKGDFVNPIGKAKVHEEVGLVLSGVCSIFMKSSSGRGELVIPISKAEVEKGGMQAFCRGLACSWRGVVAEGGC